MSLIADFEFLYYTFLIPLFFLFLQQKFPRFPKAPPPQPPNLSTTVYPETIHHRSPEVFVWDAIGGKCLNSLSHREPLRVKGHTAVHCCNFSKSGRLMGTGSTLDTLVWKGGPRVWLEDGTPRILDGSVVRITLGSPPFICHVRAICKGTNPTYRGLTNITNHGY